MNKEFNRFWKTEKLDFQGQQMLDKKDSLIPLIARLKYKIENETSWEFDEEKTKNRLNKLRDDYEMYMRLLHHEYGLPFVDFNSIQPHP